MKQTVAVIGLGNMGGTFARSLAQHSQIQVIGVDPSPEKRRPFPISYAHASELPPELDAVILAVKPQQLETLATELPDLTGIPIISMLAGTGISIIRQVIPHSPITRIMPNLAVGTGNGVIMVLHDQPSASDDSPSPITNEILADWFHSMGSIYSCSSEDQLDQLTAIFGSGPAYLYLLGEYLQQAAQAAGVASDEAAALTKTLLSGSIAYAEANDTPLAELRQQVTSKGGVTEAVIKQWHDDQLKEIINRGLAAGSERSRHLRS